MTTDELVRFPVTCPACGREALAEFRRTDVAAALVNDRPIRLYAGCCDESWTAGYIEMQQIRARLGVTRLESSGSNPTAKPRDLLED